MAELETTVMDRRDAENPTPKTPKRETRRFIALRRFFRHRLALIGTIILIIMVLASIIAPLLDPQSPWTQHLTDTLAGPSAAHPLGTDDLGRDVLARLLYGGRISFVVGFGSMLISTTIGTLFGAISGFLGGAWDHLMMRFVDLMLSFPAIFLLLVVLNLLGGQASVALMVMYLGIFGWGGLARIVRAQVLSVKELDFIVASRMGGARPWRILARHVLPNIMAPVWVSTAFAMGGSMLAEASLDFLGFGLSPSIPSWGNMLDDAQNYIGSNPMMILIPGITITIAVVAINFVGDGLRDALDPQSSVGMQRIG
ncbi:ABC transporter permease [Alicyclobacillus mengziensis]|uniref:ABC transporter permease n=1 Tax=Alicyclobacillus mengziensis TaxID=2931921 RepID=A0A9X7VZP7_9BACL|nr:ABC transporter permease [Alicyclobacillus mengziensis]QSO47827.1 ABC transporter permease [Alicyclobacillus mengziensis]